MQKYKQKTWWENLKKMLNNGIKQARNLAESVDRKKLKTIQKLDFYHLKYEPYYKIFDFKDIYTK